MMKSPMPKTPASAEYVAALCHMRSGGLVDYDSIRFVAATQAEAKQKADEWAAIALGIVTERTWLQVTQDGRPSILKCLERLNGGRSDFTPLPAAVVCRRIGCVFQ